MPVRLLTPFEKNHLLKFGFNPEKIIDYGEIPVEYITGQAKFLNDYFVVNQNVLIPRVETEELVEKIIEIYQTKKEIRFLEIGTGSGAIGLSLFNKFLSFGVQVSCVLTDVSNVALEVAKTNRNNLVDQEKQANIQLLQSDLLENLKEVNFDFCVANLPYIPSARLGALPVSVKDFEPHLALDGGIDGLAVIKRLVIELKERGFQGDVFLEVDDSHTQEKLDDLTVIIQDVWLDSFAKNRFVRLMI
ncbi:MAG: peptide chain release factor N(5)-glutamine methyltransferase [Candidatus Pacebacteria bacterium]|nr:peptide chain release factor N(5)-glutamine methyltransferase [Candidatus Paceibacterota bacterium]